MKKLKNSAMLVVAALCGYLALMTPDWKQDLVAAMNPGYQSDYVGDGTGVAGWYWEGNSNGVETQSQIWRLTYPLFSVNWGIPERFYPPQWVDQANWDIVSTGDFSGDGSADVLWRHITTAQWKVWHIDGGTRVGQTNPANFDVAHEWSIVGSGDTDNDGDDDVIMYNATTQAIQIWEMQAHNVVNTHSLGTSTYTPVRVGDFNNDGDVDIMLQTGTILRIWELQANAFVQEIAYPQTGAGWDTQCAADFDGDGDSDILLGETTTKQEKWFEMQNYTRVSQKFGSSNTGFRFFGCGDFDGDGDADTQWQRESDDKNRIVLQANWGATKQTVYTNIFGGQIPTGEGYGFVYRGPGN